MEITGGKKLKSTLTKAPYGFFKYPKQLKVAQTSVFINCSGHRFIYLWLRK